MKAHFFVFTWAGKRGPMFRTFNDALQFDAYIKGFREHTGNGVSFDGPYIAKGAL